MLSRGLSIGAGALLVLTGGTFAFVRARQMSSPTTTADRLQGAASGARAHGPNGYAEYLEATALLARNRDSKAESALVDAEAQAQADAALRTALLPAYRKSLSAVAPALEFVRKGNAEPVRYPRLPLTVVAPLFELSYFKTTARMFSRQAAVHFADGDPKGAADALLDGLAFSRRIAVAGYIHALVSLACEALLLRRLDEHAAKLGPAEIGRLERWTESALAEPTPFLAASRVEVASFRASFDSYCRDPSPWMEGDPHPLAKPEAIVRTFAAMAPADRDTFYNFVLARLERPSAALAKRLAEPESRWASPVLVAQSDDFPAPTSPYPPGMMDASMEYVRAFHSLSLEIDPDRYEHSAARERVQLRLLAVDLSILRYRQEHHRLPRTLAALPKPPKPDPVTGGSYDYRPNADGTFRLWASSRKLGRITIPDRGHDRNPL